MQIRERLSGNEAIALAMRQIDPDVVAAFPITPSTEVPQYFASFVADGKTKARFVAVESEHSAMSACIGAQAAGARAMTATSANGLALMWEMLYIAASMRLPITMANVNRALSGPINIHNDHSDSMGARDSGWLQFYSENAQEAYDNIIQAVYVAEKSALPAMVCYDGFITSHSVENIMLLEDEQVRGFVGEYTPQYQLLSPDSPISMGPLDLPQFYFEHKRSQSEAVKKSKDYIIEAQDAFYKLTGRQYSLFEEYMLSDAETALVILNSTAGTAKFVIDNLRAKGLKVGLLKPRIFRPFPAAEIAAALFHCKAVAVMDKCDGFNAAGGPLFNEVTSAMYLAGANTKMVNYIYGLGGRDVAPQDIEAVYEELYQIQKGSLYKTYNYLGVRE